jgi:hypothetical protein
MRQCTSAARASPHRDDSVDVVTGPAQELRGAVALRSDALAAPHMALQRLVRQQCVQQRRRQLRRTHWHRAAVELCLRLHHEPAQRLRVTEPHRLDGSLRESAVEVTEEVYDVTLCVGAGEGEGATKVLQDAGRVLLATQVHDHLRRGDGRRILDGG